MNINELKIAVESSQNYSQKKVAMMALCNALTANRNTGELFSVSEEFLELAQKQGDRNSEAWALLFKGMAHTMTDDYYSASEKFAITLPVFEQLGDKAGVARTTMNIGRVFMFSKEFEPAIELFEKALDMEIELENEAGIARVIGNIRNIYHESGNYEGYRTFLKEQLTICKQRENHALTAYMYVQIADVSMIHLSDYYGAIEYLNKALVIFQLTGNKKGESEALDFLGGAYWYLGDAGRSVEYALQGIAVAEEAGDANNLVNRLTNAAYSYMHLEDYHKVKELNERAKAIIIESGNTNGTGWAEMGIGMALLRLGDAAGALEHGSRAVSFIEKVGDKHGLGYAYFRCGEALAALERYEEAYETFNKSLETRKSINTVLEIAETQCEIGKLLLRFGSTDEALTILNEALDLSEKITGKAVIHATHKALADAYSSLGDFTKAYDHLQKFIAVRDEVQNQDSAKKATSIEYLHKQEILRKEQEATDRILNNVLPLSITKRLKKGQKLIADTIPAVSVIFADVVGFTPLAARLSAEDLVKLLAFIFNHFDEICRKHGLEKIKTIGDAYMAVAGAPDPCDDHALRCANAALDMLEDFAIPPDLLHDNLKGLELDFRIGIHTGSAVSGVIGESKFAYDLWGDAVNTASRMESYGEAGKIHVSEVFKNTVSESSFTFINRGEMDIKGKGIMKTYFLEKV
ncbi:MAG: tetratricopeptide repeat protein [Bacteroidetes bacterium]|nr:tetratricopeptide repeat protein [Bacteroidota bacterium]